MNMCQKSNQSRKSAPQWNHHKQLIEIDSGIINKAIDYKVKNHIIGVYTMASAPIQIHLPMIQIFTGMGEPQGIYLRLKFKKMAMTSTMLS